MLRGKIEDIMSEEVVTLQKTATISQAAHILLRFRINGVLITENKDDREVIGVLTTTDLMEFLNTALTNQGHRLHELDVIGARLVTDVCCESIMTLQKDAKIEKAVAIMHKYNKHTIPVLDGSKLVGVVGRHDILNAAFG